MKSNRFCCTKQLLGDMKDTFSGYEWWGKWIPALGFLFITPFLVFVFICECFIKPSCPKRVLKNSI